jgi:quinol monooxygenase YgiN
MYTLIQTRKETHMFAVVVTFEIKPEAVAAFTDLVCHNAETSELLEPGCHQFDVCTDPGRPNEVMLYELYSDAASFDAHRASPHYHVFTAAIEDMVRQKTVQTYVNVRQGGAEA